MLQMNYGQTQQAEESYAQQVDNVWLDQLSDYAGCKDTLPGQAMATDWQTVSEMQQIDMTDQWPWQLMQETDFKLNLL